MVGKTGNLDYFLENPSKRVNSWSGGDQLLVNPNNDLLSRNFTLNELNVALNNTQVTHQ